MPRSPKPKPTPPTTVQYVRHGQTPTTGSVLHGRAKGLHHAEAGPQQAQAEAGREHEVEASHDRPRAERLRQPGGDDEPPRPARRAREVDARGGRPPARVQIGQLVLQPARLGDPRLRLARARLGLA
jgi:hypothetical protein